MPFLAPSQWHRYLSGNRLRILMYHDISKEDDDRLTVRQNIFEQQMAYLAGHGFDIVALKTGLKLLRAGANLRRKVVLTFDDGYASFLDVVVPTLLRLAFPATLFIVPGHFGGRAVWSSGSSERGLLSELHVRQLSELGFDLGSHSMSHCNLLKAAPAELALELSRSLQWLVDLGQPFKAFAYPGGQWSKRECDAVRTTGYDCALIVGGRWGNGPETDRYLLKREPVLASDDIDWFARRVGGYYEPYYLWARMRGWATR
jgi:peptidoglycan/xylan/chitin deacetylase (PgdA/CDA1 family)